MSVITLLQNKILNITRRQAKNRQISDTLSRHGWNRDRVGFSFEYNCYVTGLNSGVKMVNIVLLQFVFSGHKRYFF